MVGSEYEREVGAVSRTSISSTNVPEPPLFVPVTVNRVGGSNALGVPSIADVSRLKLRAVGRGGTKVKTTLTPPVLTTLFGTATAWSFFSVMRLSAKVNIGFSSVTEIRIVTVADPPLFEAVTAYCVVAAPTYRGVAKMSSLLCLARQG
jgi:hypothetical protein